MIDQIGRIESTIRKVLKQPDLALKRELTSFDIQGWDSLANVRIVVALEKEFKIEIRPSEIVKARCIGDLYDLVNRKTQPQLVG